MAGEWAQPLRQEQPVRKAHGLPGDGQRAGQGAGTACVLGRGHRCHHILVSSPGASPGADVPQGCVRGSGATEQAAGSALWVDGKG